MKRFTLILKHFIRLKYQETLGDFIRWSLSSLWRVAISLSIVLSQIGFLYLITFNPMENANFGDYLLVWIACVVIGGFTLYMAWVGWNILWLLGMMWKSFSDWINSNIKEAIRLAEKEMKEKEDAIR